MYNGRLVCSLLMGDVAWVFTYKINQECYSLISFVTPWLLYFLMILETVCSIDRIKVGIPDGVVSNRCQGWDRLAIFFTEFLAEFFLGASRTEGLNVFRTELACLTCFGRLATSRFCFRAVL